MHRLSLIFLAAAMSAASLSGACRSDRLFDDLVFLTDPCQDGRATGSPGAQSVAFYLLREFRSLGYRTTVQCFESAGLAGRNVVAVTPGWYRDYIVVGAYYDGLGYIGDSFYAGADSNASGVAALLAIARGLVSSCEGSTGLIFVAFDGHNSGLEGSRRFLERFSEEYRFRMMVNLDIVGSSEVPVHGSREEYLIALGGLPFMLSMDRANRDTGLDLCFDYYGSEQFTDLFYRRIGDQSWFVAAGIPSVMFTSGITMDTNKVTDTLDRLDLDMLSKRITFIMRWLDSMI